MKIPAEWHKKFIKNSFYNPASPAALARAPAEARFVMRAMKLKKGDRLLDLCCGPARHALLLAGKGLAVTGYDFSAEYLKEAAAKAEKAKVKIRFLRGDMRALKFSGEFDAAINLFTSFGYFLKFSDDLKTLKGAARALKPGGLFMLDIIHGDYVRNNFSPKNWAKLEDGSYCLEHLKLTKDGALNSWTVIRNGKALERRFFSRLYSRARISAALRKAGLVPLKFWGSFNGAPLTSKTNRLIALARKPHPPPRKLV